MDFDSEYTRLGHALQTGVAFEHEHGSDDGSPKHLRVGVNLRAVDHTALVTLLARKGLITLEEYGELVIQMLQEEVKRYEARIAARVGHRGITLG